MRSRRAMWFAPVLSAFALAACQSGQPANGSSGQQGSGPSSGSAPGSAPAAVQPTGPFHANLVLVRHPEVTASGKNILVTVAVTNDGTGTFGSASGRYGVNLGAHSIDATGKVVDLNLARGHLPQIAPGTTQQASIRISVAGALGHRIELLPVDEGVAWFDKWDNKPLVIGPFNACPSGSSAKVCDAAGQPLPVASSQQP